MDEKHDEIVVDEIRKTIIAGSQDVPNPQIGAVSFLHSFGATLNVHPHFHLIFSDGIFFTERDSLKLQFREAFLTEWDIQTTQENIQKRVLKLFERKGRFSSKQVEKMLTYENSGFSLNARVKINAWDRDGLERLIRYFIHQSVEKIKRASLDWAQLIKRIYEIDPLQCSKCGKKIKIIGFVTHQAEIYRILKRIGHFIELHEFDPAYDLNCLEFSQLISDSVDGFSVMEEQQEYISGSDPPFFENHKDPPHWEETYDSFHQEQEIDSPHWED